MGEPTAGREHTFISMSCDAMMRHIRAPRSFHIPAAIESAFASAARAFVLHSPSRPASASR